jgi:hypothetical protein
MQTKIKIMTVAELIEILKDMPQDYTVIASTQDGGCYEVTEVYEHHEAFREVELS